MNISISQPTFLPYEGYFGLINYVDKFIFLDNVQFNKRSWQQRNWLIIGKKEKLLTIPVLSKSKFHQILNEAEIDYKNFDLKFFFSSLEMNYKNTKFFDLYYPEIKEIFNKKHKYLYDLNIELIKKICFFYEIKTSFFYSSDFEIKKDAKKELLLLELIKKNNCKRYISTIGSKKYLGNNSFFLDNNIKINYFEYSNNGFKGSNKNCENLSVLDCLFRDGINSKKKIINNFKIID